MPTTREQALENALHDAVAMLQVYVAPAGRNGINSTTRGQAFSAILDARAALALPPSPQPPPVAEGALSYDGHGVNGPDEYRSRLATFTDSAKQDGRADQFGPLLAAAPDMLAALREIESWTMAATLVKAGEPDQFGGEARAVNKIARAAIARATGAPGDHPEQPAPEHFAHHD